MSSATLTRGTVAPGRLSSPVTGWRTSAVWVVTAVCVAVYLLSGPPHDGDLAAQTARADIFGRVGFVPWYAGWYSGLHLGGYSLLSPALLWWLNPAVLGAVCLGASGPLSHRLLRAGGARRPAFGAVTFTVFQLADLLSGRITFALGEVLALVALWAAERGRAVTASAFALLASLASPIDGLLLLAAALLYLVAARHPLRRWRSTHGVPALMRGARERVGLGLAVGAAVGLLVVIKAFPDPGFEPFTFAAMRPVAEISVVVALLPVGYRVRRGAVLALLLVLGAYLVHSPIGSNAQRPPLLLAVPAVAAALAGPLLFVVPVMIALAVWPYHQLRDDLTAAKDPAAHAAFYAPLVSELRDQPALAGQRLEVVEPRTHWQVVYLEPEVTLARGWERQLDESLNPALYNRPTLTASSYRAFLDRNAVAEVALPHGTPIDFGSGPEAALIGRGLPYLRQVWSDPHWTLYAVSDPAAVATGAGAQVDALTDTGVVVSTTGPGAVTLRMRYSSYLTVAGGQVSRGPGDTTVVKVDQGGEHDVHARWTWSGFMRALD